MQRLSWSFPSSSQKCASNGINLVRSEQSSTVPLTGTTPVNRSSLQNVFHCHILLNCNHVSAHYQAVTAVVRDKDIGLGDQNFSGRLSSSNCTEVYRCFISLWTGTRCTTSVQTTMPQGSQTASNVSGQKQASARQQTAACNKKNEVQRTNVQ